MSMKNFATRMSCFSLISAIESDLRIIIAETINQGENIEKSIPNDVLQNIKKRFYENHKEEYKKEYSVSSLLEFTDFSDLSKLLHKNKETQSIFSKEEIIEVTKKLEQYTTIRNRICHSRPLEPSDIVHLTDFSVELLKLSNRERWKNIQLALNNLNDPAFALSLKIPEYWNIQNNQIYNNLPLPEFDDTGFLGREKERESIKQLIYSYTKVISIIGEGGIGKTAIALRCLYDVLEEMESSDSNIFDMIIWVSLKANRLTASGVEQIKNSITNSIGLYNEIVKNVGGDTGSTLEETISEIKEYMEQFNILLCIDNLETISSNEVREFLANIPDRSKVVITTRVGLGELEYRYKLDKLDEKSSVNLMRTLSRLLNVESISKKNNESLKQISIRLFNNPLLMKWYVLSLANGKGSSSLLNKENQSYQEALKFCFEKLYEQLKPIEKKLINAITYMRRPVSAVELRFVLDDLGELEIEDGLHQLNNSSMLKSVSNSSPDESITYILTDIAEEFISSSDNLDLEIFSKVKSKKKELQVFVDANNTIKNHHNFDLNSIYWHSKDQKICSIYLKQAIDTYKRKKDLESALTLVKKAKSIMPEYSECYRINGYLFMKTNPFKAENEFETAIQYDRDSAISYYAYAQFLINQEEFDRAKEQIDSALKINNDDISLLTMKAWLLTMLGEFNSAIEIYTYLLPLQEGRLRKFAISTYTQAINCHKRYAEIMISDQDFNQAANLLSAAINILNEAFTKAYIDNGIIEIAARLLNEANNYEKKCSNAVVTSNLFTTFEENINELTADMKAKSLTEFSSIYNNLLLHNQSKLQIILEKLEESHILGSSMFGHIKSVNRTVNNTVSFGFITGDDKSEYFFHRGELTPSNLLDSIQNIQGVKVKFITSETKKGRCANQIERITNK